MSKIRQELSQKILDAITQQWHNRNMMVHQILAIPALVSLLHLAELAEKQEGYEVVVVDNKAELPGTLIDELEYCEHTCFDFRWGVAAARKDMAAWRKVVSDD